MKQLSSAQATKTLKIFEAFPETRDGNERGAPSETVECKAPRLWILTLFVRLVVGTANWIRTAADYYSAATIYEQLSRLSDAELQRRGFTRANLAREVTAACDRVDRSAD